MESWEIILIVVGSVVSLFLLYILLAMIFSFGPYADPWDEVGFRYKGRRVRDILFKKNSSGVTYKKI